MEFYTRDGEKYEHVIPHFSAKLNKMFLFKKSHEQDNTFLAQLHDVVRFASDRTVLKHGKVVGSIKIPEGQWFLTCEQVEEFVKDFEKNPNGKIYRSYNKNA